MLPIRNPFLSPLVGLVSILSLGFACTGCGDEVDEVEEGPARIVAIGDLHGDLEAARAALRLGGAIDGEDRWIGGELVVVQTGDILDRGDDERAIMALFQRLKEEAELAGGAVHVLNGNHELMNSYVDLRYVTEGGYADFEGVDEVDPVDSLLASLEPAQRARAAAFRPGGSFARLLADQTIQVVIGKTIFAHAGILPEHLDLGLERMEGDVRSWLLDEAPQPEWIRGDRSPVWNRLYSDQPDPAACDTLALVLDRLGVERMVVGHTVQPTGITSFCGGRVWCIDVGMAAHYGGRTEVLEIKRGKVRGLR
ncbi:MAG: calcineurin [Gemmatimonadales bacterium]|nr:MAG: calcineurin [Gemmatimonadales bacterium]